MERIQYYRKVLFILIEKKVVWYILILFYIKINVFIVGISKMCCSEGLWEKVKKFFFFFGWYYEVWWFYVFYYWSE